jgi:Asp-tRNA(Asn)/Glu-tRNA(Gln) amidotransferase A subunit family amidase
LRHAAVLDQPGIISRDVADAALLVEAMIGRDPEDEFSFDVARPDLETALSDRLVPKLAFVRGPFWDRADVKAGQAIVA